VKGLSVIDEADEAIEPLVEGDPQGKTTSNDAITR